MPKLIRATRYLRAIWAMIDAQCDECGGSGGWEECPTCHGNGTKGGKPCPQCAEIGDIFCMSCSGTGDKEQPS